MNYHLYQNWNTDAVIAGYTSDCGGHFKNCEPADWSNYRALADALGFTVDEMVRVWQKHTDKVFVADRSNGGDGILRDGIPEPYDALITDAKGLMLCEVTADCAPVFLWDEEHLAIGIVHSGRLGVTKEIAFKAVARMSEIYSSDPAKIRCILGPYLCQPHHEIEKKDADAFLDRFSKEEMDRFIEFRGEKAYVDMGIAIRISLMRAGVRDENIYDERVCTFENKQLFSWRRDHDPSARNLSFIALRRNNG